MTVHADFTSQAYFRNPTAEIEKLRAAGPVVEVRFPLVGTVWTTTTQDLANQVLRDSGTFILRKDDGDVVGFRWWMPNIVRTIANNMLSTDEPDHARLRASSMKCFAGGRCLKLSLAFRRSPANCLRKEALSISSTAMREGCRFR
jgi:cytochrome P450